MMVISTLDQLLLYFSVSVIFALASDAHVNNRCYMSSIRLACFMMTKL